MLLLEIGHFAPHCLHGVAMLPLKIGKGISLNTLKGFNPEPVLPKQLRHSSPLSAPIYLAFKRCGRG